MFTKEHARVIMNAYDMLQILGDDEEMELLEANNTNLAASLYAIHRFAYGADKDCKVENGVKV